MDCLRESLIKIFVRRWILKMLNKTKRLVSIIVPVYNSERHLRKCLISLCEQSYEEIEILLINDGSTDYSLEICKEFQEKDKRVIIMSQENSGVSAARNKGIDVSKGEYICFVDSDDSVETGYIEKYINTATETNADIVIGGVTEVHGNIKKMKTHKQEARVVEGTEILPLAYSLLDNRTDAEETFNPQIMGYPWCRIYKKSIIGGTRFNCNIFIREDAVFNLEVFNRATRISIIDYAGYNYVFHEQMATGNFRTNFELEIFYYLNICRNICRKYYFPRETYFAGVLYAYMIWLKMGVLHINSSLPFFEKTQVIRCSFENTIWKEAFLSVDSNDLSKAYRILKILYKKKSVLGIMSLYYLSRFIERKH